METIETIDLKIQNAIAFYATTHKITLINKVRSCVSMLKPCPEAFPQEFFESFNVTGILPTGRTVTIVCKDEKHITHVSYDQLLEKSRQKRVTNDYIPRHHNHCFNFGQMTVEFI